MLTRCRRDKAHRRNASPTELLQIATARTPGVKPVWFSPQTTGPLVREAQRHLAQFVLLPIAEVVAQECSEKFGGPVPRPSSPKRSDTQGSADASYQGHNGQESPSAVRLEELSADDIRPPPRLLCRSGIFDNLALRIAHRTPFRLVRSRRNELKRSLSTTSHPLPVVGSVGGASGAVAREACVTRNQRELCHRLLGVHRRCSTKHRALD